MKENLFMKNKLEEDIFMVRNLLSDIFNKSTTDVKRLLESISLTDGKMLRAMFVLIGGSFGSIAKDRLIHICAATELLHLATLVHDDIIDDSSVRRGKATLNSSYGIKYGLFIGDYLFSESYVLFASNSSSQSIIQVSNTIKNICEGEVNQFFSTYTLSSNVRNYFRRINGKCACFFSLSLSIGAIEGISNYETIKLLKKIGYYTGMAFQIIDDILDFSSSEVALGKPAGNDIVHGIYNLPIILEIKNNNSALIESLKRKDINMCIEIIKTSNGIEKSREIAQSYTTKALINIDKLPESEERFILKNIVEKLLLRPY